MPLKCSPLQAPVILFLAILAGNVPVWCYPTGAGQQACPAQSPQICHKASPQTSPSPYSLVVKDTTYSPGTSVNVSIVSSGNVSFVGFLVGAHRVQGNTTEYLGSFSASAKSQPMCGANGNTGVTHTSADPKQSIILVWTAPATNQGDLVFSGAIVQNFNTYWVNVSSGVLKPHGYHSSNDTTTTAPPSVTQFPKDPGCGQTRACYGRCQDNAMCTFLSTWYTRNQSLIISMTSVVSSADNVWMALGFGRDAKMNPASVVACVVYQGQVKAFTSYNKDYGNERVSPNASIGLGEVRGNLTDGVFTCRVHRQLVVAGGGPHVYNLTTLFHILMAQGRANAWNKLPHDPDNAFVTDDSHDVSSHVDIGAKAPSSVLVKLHGILMTVAWLFCASTGVLVARFYKPAWPSQSVCGVHIWFAVHRAVMIVATLATLAGVVIIFLHVGGWSQLGGGYEGAHPYLGIAVATLTVLNPVMAVFRCDPSHERRPIFDWAHFVVGNIVFTAALITVGIGLHLLAVQVPSFVTVCALVYTAWIVLSYVMLEITKCREKNDKMVGAYKDLQSFTQGFDAIGYHTFRQTIFALHVLVALGITIVIICFIIGF